MIKRKKLFLYLLFVTAVSALLFLSGCPTSAVPEEPGIQVLYREADESETEILEGTTCDIGSADTGNALTCAFLIRNSGTADLQIAGDPIIQINPVESKNILNKSVDETTLTLFLTALSQGLASCTTDNGSDYTGDPLVIRMTNGDGSVTQEYSYSTSGGYPYTGDGSFVFTGYTYEGITVNGTLSFDYTADSDTEFSFAYSGTLTYTYESADYEVIYDYTFSSADGTVTFSGTQTVDGVTYTYNSDGSIDFTADTGDDGDGDGDGEETADGCFTLDVPPGETIVPGGSTSFSITFTPNGTDRFSVDGGFRSQVVINTNCPGDYGEFTFFIEGTETTGDGDGDGDGEEEPPTVADPVFSVEPGTYTERQTVRVTCETPGASIYYTTDGITEPDDSLTPYGSSISFSFSSTTTIKAIAYAEGYEPSSVVTGTYTIEKSIELDKTDITLVILEPSTYSDYEDNEYILPTISPQDGETVSWSIDDPTVAELNGNWYQMYVYPKSAGTATITATLEGTADDQVVTATCTVTVLASIEKADDVEFLYHFGDPHTGYQYRTELYIRGNTLYFVDSPADLQTNAVLNAFDVTNPAGLGPRNTTDLGYNHSEFLYYNEYLIGFDSTDMTLYFHPLSSPAATYSTYTVSDFTNFQDIKLEGSMIYLLGQNTAGDQMKLVMVNIANPESPGLYSSMESLSGTSPDHPLPGRIGISGNTIYTASAKISAQANYLFTIDTSDPQNLTVTDPDIYLQSGAGSSWASFDIRIVTGNSLITQIDSHIRFYDLNNLSETNYKDMYLAYAYIQHFTHNNLLWVVCNGWSGQTDQPLDLFDISDPSDPHKIGSFYISTEYEYTMLHNFGVTATDTHVFVMTSEGLKSFSYATADN